ncbi:MAG: D-alanyl-D-alanine carboxypeptidase [Clostridiales bacterium]|jgi:D-alanyl-D-alanine carboxypeptidase|nr:D-alanyl-D-alanine carboxypeptidase [Clostridiales bacterium]
MKLISITSFSRIMALAILLTIISSLICPKASAISAKGAVLIDATYGRVLMQHNANTKLGPASTTKIMTALIALENAPLDKTITATNTIYQSEGTSLYLKVGEQMTLEDALYGLLLESGNDVALAIAESIGGSVDNFVDMMNKKCYELGLSNTHFVNPHGLSDDEHYTTAYDLAQITRQALKNNTFCQIISTKKKTISGDRVLDNHNKLLDTYPNANGVKTGYTKATGRTLVSSATRDELTLIAVTLNDGDDWADHAEMLDYGFDNYKKVTVNKKGDYLSTQVTGKGKYLGLVASSDVILVANDKEIEGIQYEYTNGKVYAKYNGTFLGEGNTTVVGSNRENKNENSDSNTRTKTFWNSFFKLISWVV